MARNNTWYWPHGDTAVTPVGGGGGGGAAQRHPALVRRRVGEARRGQAAATLSPTQTLSKLCTFDSDSPS